MEGQDGVCVCTAAGTVLREYMLSHACGLQFVAFMGCHKEREETKLGGGGAPLDSQRGED